MTNVQELIAAIHNLNQRVTKLEAGITSHKRAIETFFSAIDDLKEKVEHLGPDETAEPGVVDVEG